MSRRLRAALAAAAAAGLLTGCTGIPASTTPQVVANQVGAGAQSAGQTFAPTPGADPRTIVLEFLQAVSGADAGTAARAFLSPTVRSTWSDTTISILDAPPQVSTVVNGVVTVSGREIGSVATATGVYSPVLQGDGSGEATDFSFTVTSVDGQNRISALPSGIIVPATTFEQVYLQREVYFYDLSEQGLVPDLRYSALQGAQLANWLAGQLVAGPSAQLASAASSAIPATTDPSAVTVSLGSAAPSVVTIPGAGQLDPQARNLLAQQLAFTLNQVLNINDLTIVDGGRAVSVPAVGGTRFAASDFANTTITTPPAPALYYVRNGALVDQTGHPVPGPVGAGNADLDSVAVAAIAGIRGLLVAGVSGPVGAQRLLIGTAQSGLHATGVRGQLSRPAWAPGLAEVWVGVGGSLVRCPTQGAPAAVPLHFPGTPAAGAITAVRLSPDGDRVAIVFTGSDGAGHLWIGSVVRSQKHVQVNNLNQITPVGVSITDVGWADTVELFVIGTTSGGQTNIYELQVDGSRWIPRGITNLPQAPDSITVAVAQAAWVSAGHTVWEQPAGGSWASPGTGTTPGTNPVYEE